MVVGRSDFLLGWVLLTFQGRFLLNFREVNKMKTHQATSTLLSKTTKQKNNEHRRLLMIFFLDPFQPCTLKTSHHLPLNDNSKQISWFFPSPSTSWKRKSRIEMASGRESTKAIAVRHSRRATVPGAEDSGRYKLSGFCGKSS